MQNIPEQYKIYKGRIFYIRNKKFIPVSKNKVEGRSQLYYLNAKETFGEAIFVYDETNVRVAVTTLSGELVWIPKNCLLNEFKNCNTNNTNKEVEINNLIRDVIETNLPNEKKAAIAQLLRESI